MREGQRLGLHRAGIPILLDEFKAGANQGTNRGSLPVDDLKMLQVHQVKDGVYQPRQVGEKVTLN